MEKNNVSLDTIAKDLNVSKVTVSKALNDKEGVGEELRQKIKDRANELGYHIPSMARGLKSNKAYNIGILIPERFMMSSGSYYFQVYALFVKKFAEAGYNGIMEVLDREAEEELILPKMLLEKKIDGLIILGECSKNYLSLFTDVSIPVLFFDFYDDEINVDSITLDNFYSGQMITKYLLNRGLKNITFVGNIYSTSSIKDRFLGYARALLDNKIKLNLDSVISDRNDEGFIEGFKLPSKLPEAFVCNNDELAYHVIKILLDNGIKVPEDISVVAFDNTIFSELSNVKITTVDTNASNMVEVATKAILKKINVPTKIYDRILIKGTIIERDSVRKKEV